MSSPILLYSIFPPIPNPSALLILETLMKKNTAKNMNRIPNMMNTI